jgi:hypothetical protein
MTGREGVVIPAGARTVRLIMFVPVNARPGFWPRESGSRGEDRESHGKKRHEYKKVSFHERLLWREVRFGGTFTFLFD